MVKQEVATTGHKKNQKNTNNNNKQMIKKQQKKQQPKQQQQQKEGEERTVFDNVSITSKHLESSDNHAFTKMVRDANKEKRKGGKKAATILAAKNRLERERSLMEEKLMEEYNEKYGKNWYIQHTHRLKPYLQPVSEEALKKLQPDQVEAEYTKCLVEYRKFKKTGNNTMHDFEKNFLTKGTRSDRVATIVEVLRRDPLPHLDLLDRLLQECQHQHSSLALTAARELFCTLLMPIDPPVVSSNGTQYKLLPFTSLLTHHLSRQKSRNKSYPTEGKSNAVNDYVIMYVCDTLQKRYSAFLDILSQLSKNKASHTYREEALKTISQCLPIKTSQHKLVTLLVNMLDDPEGVVVEKAMKTISYYLQGANHITNFRGELIRELVLFLYKPKVDEKKRRNAAVLLAQARYEPVIDYSLARHVNDAMMKMIRNAFMNNSEKKSRKNTLAKFSEGDGGFMSSLLIGYWRTYKVANDRTVPDDVRAEAVDQVHWKLFADLARHGPFSISFEALRALWVMYQHDSSDESFSNVLHNILYSKLNDANILSSSKLESFLLLILHVMSNDPNIARVYAFTKRLMQSCLHGSSAYASAVLLTLVDAMKAVPAIQTLLNSNGLVDDEDDEDEEMPPIKAEIKSEENGEQLTNNKKKSLPKVYNVREAEPKKAGADTTSLWELTLLQDHYHPAVHTITSHFTEDAPITYRGNPFEDFKIIKFIDEFVFDRKRMKNQQKRQMKAKYFKDQRITPFKIETKAVEVPKNYEEMLEKRKSVPQHLQFLKKFTELKKEIEERQQKVTEQIQKKKDKKKSKKKLAIPVGSVDIEDDDDSKYSYKNLAKAVSEDLDEMAVDTMMLENASDDEDEDNIAQRLAKREALPGADDDDDDTMREAQGEMSDLFEKEEERLLEKKNKKKMSKKSATGGNAKKITKPSKMAEKLKRRKK